MGYLVFKIRRVFDFIVMYMYMYSVHIVKIFKVKI